MRHTFLDTSISRQNDNMVIENSLLSRVKGRSCHFLGNGKTDSISDTLTKWARCALNTRRFAELWMSGSVASELPKIFELVQT